MQYANDIIFTGRIDDDEINDVLASAVAFVFVPSFEGFGIPLLEAMQCDIPIIASNITSVPEVVNDAGLLVNPHNPEEIKNAMYKVATDENLRLQLIQKGRIRKNFFSWEKTANLLWESIKKSL